MMQLLLRPRSPQQRKLKRYDEEHKDKFDFATRQPPFSQSFSSGRSCFEALDAEDATPTTIAVPLADINLQARGKVGLLLGSVVKYLISPPRSITDLDNHRDLDVLILDPHTRDNPAPNEWGIDWWVRPKGQAPANGRTSLWYDIALKSHVASFDKRMGFSEKSLKTERPLDINKDDGFVYSPELAESLKAERKFLKMAIRKNLEAVLIPAGLYLPDPQLMDQIVDHCEKRADQSDEPKNFSYLRLGDLDMDKSLLPVLPSQFVDFKPMHFQSE